jgi:hypothetical protein
MPEEQQINSDQLAASETRVEWEELLRANLSKNEEVLQLIRQVKSHIRWQVAWSFIRLFLIIIPIILGFIYLPPIVKDFLETYSFLMPY